MASPIRDQVSFHYTPDRASLAAGLAARDVSLAPTERALHSSGRLLRAFYDEETGKTYTLAVSKGGSKRYLALPELAWREMLPELRSLHPDETNKSIVDLSSRWIIGLEQERNDSLFAHQIDPDNVDDRPRFNALVNLRTYLVQQGYAQAPTSSISEGYDLHTGARTTFAARPAPEIGEEARRLHTDGIIAATAETTGREHTRLAQLPDFLNQKRTRLEAKRAEIEADLKRAPRNDLRLIENLNRDLATTKEQLTALGRETEISWASALLDEAYNFAECEDWKALLRGALGAKNILLNYLTQNAEQPISPVQMRKFEERATDIASLLIPPAIGQGDEKKSGEAIFHLFYGGTQTLSELAAGENETLPAFTPVATPRETGHAYLRSLLAEFHAHQMEPLPQPEGQNIFDE